MVKFTFRNAFAIFVGIFLTYVPFSFGQKIMNIQPSYNIKQDGLSHKFTLADFSLNEKKRYNHRKTYYWYKAQKVIATQGGSAGIVLNGTYQSFYPSNQLCEKGEFKKGLKIGEWKQWYQNGALKKVERWKKGRLVGRQTFYDEKGQINKLVRLSRFKKEIITADTLIVERGNRLKISTLDSLGEVRQVERYKKQRAHGKHVFYKEDSDTEVIRYKKGVLLTKKVKEEKTDKTKEEKERKFNWFKKEGDKDQESKSKKEKKPRQEKNKKEPKVKEK
jgi:antitoxin component YwqK of YwqJK toxin-antitoxin module